MTRVHGMWRLLAVLALLTLSACSSQRTRPVAAGAPAQHYEPMDGPPTVTFDVSKLPEPVPRDEVDARYGNHTPYDVMGKRYAVLPRRSGYSERGIASWYGTKFHGRLTSTREPYDMYQFTAAHKTLPLPSYARVTRLDSGKSVVVRINDRGPFVGERLIDLSYAAAVKLGVHLTGTAPVEVTVLEPGMPVAAAPRAPTPDPAPTVRSLGSLYLQVGAFSARQNAFKYRRRLLAAEFTPVRVFSARVPTGRVYRVRIGPLKSLGEVENVRARIRAAGFGEPRILSQ